MSTAWSTRRRTTAVANKSAQESLNHTDGDRGNLLKNLSEELNFFERELFICCASSLACFEQRRCHF